MFTENLKQIQRMAPLMQRVLIVDPAPASARLLADLMRNIANVQLWHAPTTRKGLEAARQVNPQLIFVELSGTDVDGVQFSRQLRRSHAACRMAPIIMVTATATAAAILAARDAGVHEFLRKPYTTKDLLRRLEAVTLHPRDWIEAVGYVGPDRRRFNSGEYAGPQKRKADKPATAAAAALAVKDQALRILAASLAQFDSDPMQALRAVKQQAETLKSLAMKTSDTRLAVAAAGLEGCLASGAPTKAGLAGPIGAILALAEPGTELARAG